MENQTEQKLQNESRGVLGNPTGNPLILTNYILVSNCRGELKSGRGQKFCSIYLQQAEAAFRQVLLGQVLRV